jgi:6-phosphogluconolactonase
VANYSVGTGGPDQQVVVFGIDDDGSLTAPLDSVAHEGTGPNAERQERSHAHSVTESLSGNVAIVADLGIDCMVTYRIGEDGMLDPLAETGLKPGAGPRHIALHPNGRFVFVMNELDSSIVSLALDADSGALTFVDVMPAVPSEARQSNHCADIQISPDGRFVYGSNRGHDSISIFGVDAETGKFTPVGYVPCGGATPRNLCLTPSGSHLLSANQNADKITIFQRDSETGLLADTGKSISIGTPMCIKIVE